MLVSFDLKNKKSLKFRSGLAEKDNILGGVGNEEKQPNY
jgi:hypothetical protein